jgi:hypothetical protein
MDSPSTAGGRRALLRGLKLLRDYGFVFVTGVPADMVATEAACKKFGQLQVGKGVCASELIGGTLEMSATALVRRCLYMARGCGARK